MAAFVTSYIPTVASQVTRSADAASMTGTNLTSWLPLQSEGTLYAEAACQRPTNSVGFIVNLSFVEPFAGSLQFSNTGRLGAVVVGAFDTRTAAPTWATGTFYRTAVALQNLNNAHAVNGSMVSASSTAGFLASPNQLTIGNIYWGGLPLNGTIRRLAYYPKRLSNIQLQAITS